MEEFTFRTQYDQRAMTAMARALRKTVRRKRSRRVRAFGWLAAVLGTSLLLLPGGAMTPRRGLTLLAVAVLVAVLLFEDSINGYLSRKRLPPGMDRAESVFTAGGLRSATALGRSEFPYDRIAALAETREYFVLIYGASHAQVYDKSSLRGGTADGFRAFLERVTGKQFQNVGA